jgi:transcriptional regulator with XRE-family HTH domain
VSGYYSQVDEPGQVEYVAAVSDDQAYALIFGRVLSTLRERSNLSQTDLAKRAQIAQGTLSRIEAGKLRPDIVMARRLAIAVGVTYEQLSATVEAAFARTRAYAAKVTDKPSSKTWVDDLAAIAPAVGLLALAMLGVAALMEEEVPRRRRGNRGRS